MSKPTKTAHTYDVRSIERNIKHGVITRKDVQAHLDSLPDVADKAITLAEVEDNRADRAEKAGGEGEGGGR